MKIIVTLIPINLATNWFLSHFRPFLERNTFSILMREQIDKELLKFHFILI